MFAVEQAASDARGKLRHSRVYPIKIASTTINFAQVALFCVFSTAIGGLSGIISSITNIPRQTFFEQVQRDTFHLILTFFRRLSVHTKLLKYFLSLLTMQTYGPVTYNMRGAQGVGNADIHGLYRSRTHHKQKYAEITQKPRERERFMLTEYTTPRELPLRYATTKPSTPAHRTHRTHRRKHHHRGT